MELNSQGIGFPVPKVLACRELNPSFAPVAKLTLVKAGHLPTG